MIHYKNYVRPKDLEEAFTMNAKKSAVIAGGFCFLRLQNRNIGTLLDLRELLSDRIEETEEEFRIGAMVSLRQLELHEGLNDFMSGAARDCVCHIVGTQFRNCATVGGSIFGRFGFSDILTCFLVMDSWVELYRGGRIPLSEFAAMKADGDIMTALIVKKTGRKAAYEMMRNEAVDFPVLSVAVSEDENGMTRLAVGARPARASVIEAEGLLSVLDGEKRRAEAEKLAGRFTYGTNMRGSAEYREYLAGVLIGRAAGRIGALREGQEGRRNESDMQD
ncbi:FAD binding domain-containing protein [[Clostridium] symbiosum]|uniref:FAD binding domain-containing protein n=1 Tax=Clostridium symbiosum TaxID=1512 RepID=UPI001D087357|nr:FAD binding domain-containing protein [[Clostridium] symbiosum]MCB6610411.1 FAD binding domain-containing protein [[Clostridium] symbiosum]MCB6933445.1 FAD binding domain-containing protein [[Clostridium] symbiosum]